MFISVLFLSTMVGDIGDGDGNPKDFNECVSQEQLPAVVERAQE